MNQPKVARVEGQEFTDARILGGGKIYEGLEFSRTRFVRCAFAQFDGPPQELVARNVTASDCRADRCNVQGAYFDEVVEETRYLARPYRWRRLWDELLAIDLDAPHPRAAEWEKIYGREIPGASTAAQAALVRSWLDTDQRDPAELEAVSFGSRRPSALERATDASFGGQDWAGRLTARIGEHFAGTRWPLQTLVPRDGGAEAGPRNG
jgi:hypothetical protein